MKGKKLLTPAGSICLALVIVVSVLVAACAAPAPAPTPAPPTPAPPTPAPPTPAPPTPAPAAPPPEKVHWDFNMWGGPRAWTYAVEDWAEEMEKRSNGQFHADLHYGAVLSPPKENLDGLKAGLFEATMLCTGYAPGKLPLWMVYELPFMPPSSAVEGGHLQEALFDHPAIRGQLLDRWNGVPLLSGPHSSYSLMGTKRIEYVEDIDGVRMRMTGELAKVFEKFGAVPTMMPAPECYTAIERGTIDAVYFPWSYGQGSYKIHEVSQYVTIGFPGAMLCCALASKDAWDALPENLKAIHRELYKKNADVYASKYAEADAKWIPIFKEYGIEIIEMPDEEMAKLVAEASKVWEEWVKEREFEGMPGREVLDYCLAKKAEIAGK